MTKLTHLAIDAVGTKYGGGATVLLAFVEAALELEALSALTLWASPRADRQFQLPTDSRLLVVSAPRLESSPLLRLGWHQGGMAAETRRVGADVLVCMNGGGYGPAGVPNLTFIQQSLPFCAEALDTLSSADRLRMAAVRAVMKTSTAHASKIAVQTATMKAWVAEAFGLPLEKFEVFEPSAQLAPQSATSVSLAQMRRTPAGKRVLYVGSTSLYKNLERAFEGFSQCARIDPEARLFATIPADHPLVCARPEVVGLGYLDAPELREAYSLCSFLLMPSLVETVGLPMLEAANLGKPTLAADRPYAHDVCGPAARYFDPLDARSIAAGLSALLREPSELARMGALALARSRALSAARPYERMAQAVVDLALDRRTPLS